MQRLYLCLSLMTCALSMDNLRVVYEWKELDFDFPTEKDRREAITNGHFIPENNLPLGLEVHGDRLFVTVPRWRSGVAASLTYINLSDSSRSPRLRPYPTWEAHSPYKSRPQLVSPFRLRADRCHRLWVVDTGLEDLLGNDTRRTAPPRLLVYDLRTDTLLRDYPLPPWQAQKESLFANVAVEDHADCEDAFAYLADLGRPGLVVYSWRKNQSWRVKHHFFHPDPLAGEFNISDISFQWDDGLFGLALSGANEEGFSTLYFHPLASTDEFAVSTKYLRDEQLANNSFHRFRRLGSRGTRGQSGVSFLDQKTDVLFYALVNLNAVACWRTTNRAYTMESQGRVYMSNVTMVFPNDIKVDSNDNLWVLSDRLSTFMYDTLDVNDVNFRILMAPVADAIRGTACDSKLVISPNLVEKLKPKSNDKASSVSRIEVRLSLMLIVFAAIRIL